MKILEWTHDATIWATWRPEGNFLAQKNTGLCTEIFFPCLYAGLQKPKVVWERCQYRSPKSGPGEDVSLLLSPPSLILCFQACLYFLPLTFSLLNFSYSLFFSFFFQTFFLFLKRPFLGTKIECASTTCPKSLIFLMFNIFSLLFINDIWKL